MIKYTGLLLLMAFVCHHASAQNGYGSTSIYDETTELPKGKHIFTLPPNDYWYKQSWADSIYLFDRFQPGKIELATGVTPTNSPLLNYNIFLQSMVIKEDNKEYVQLTERGITTIWIGDRKFIYHPFQGYVEVILEGRISIAERTSMAGIYELSNLNKYKLRGLDVRTGIAKFTRHYWEEKEYFIFTDREHLHPATFGALLKMNSKQKNAVRQFGKENKTDYKKKDDLVKIVLFSNREL